MGNAGDSIGNKIREHICAFFRSCICFFLSVGPVPNHVGFIMDGNRRYAKRRNLTEGAGHRAGFLALTSILRNCCELGVKYVTVYAFSIDNFKRDPDEVHALMELMQEKIELLIKEESIVNRHGVRVLFIGNLKLLSDSLRSAAERVMLATASNSKAVLSICVAYTSTNEITHAIQESCEEKRAQGENFVKLVDIEKRMYTSVVPDPDILVRTSGETRLSNFLLWQTADCLLYAPSVLWPDIGFWHMVWAVLNFQRDYGSLRKKAKQL